MSVPDEVVQLVERFELHRESYLSSKYNETQLRREFVDPFFKALGWDVDNEQGYAEAYKDVIHEDAIQIGGTTKAPDYCFRIGGQRKFFVETKKPSVNIATDVSPAFQLRRYAWTAKLPLSILTDFEELAVYDCLIHKPVKTDKASKARTMYLQYTEYAERWDDIASIFSREAILKGSFDKYAEQHRKKRGTAEVDAEFLKEIENWRTLLARNLALRNPDLSQRELNFAVQRTIDRIIFLRICEDRGVERMAQLRALLNGDKVYPRLSELFQRADERYNSGLFHFHKEKDRPEEPDTFTLSLAIDDKPLKEIIGHLYYPDSPYEFSVFPADILGQVYEQFLGKVIRLTKGHQAKIEEKPEVKKAGGVYYTPTYIVDYIVEQTVGKLVEGKTPQEVGGLTPTWKLSTAKGVRPLKVLDPACGSGSFLIGAYQYLLDWYRDWYVEDGTEKHKERIYEAAGGEWRLTTVERKRILLSHIYGVDIDPQAVEVTKLSLLLKVLEGENQETLNRQLKMFHERALPDLSHNIKCGNSLIGPDFYAGQQMSLFDEEELLRINAFDWEREFSEVMGSGGFDAVIGNPPYIRIQRIGHAEADYLFRKFTTPASKTDLSLLFIEFGLSHMSSRGRSGFICTSQWLATDYGRKLRATLSDGRLRELVDFGSLPVFKNVSTYPAILILSTEPASQLILKRITNVDDLTLSSILASDVFAIKTESLSDAPWNLGFLDVHEILARGNKAWKELGEFGRAHIGTKSGRNEVFILDRETASELKLEDSILFPYAYRGEEIHRYSTINPSARIIYPYFENGEGNSAIIKQDQMRRRFPKTFKYLSEHKEVLQQRLDSRKRYATGDDWYRHLRAGSFRYIRPAKIVVKGIAMRCCAGLLPENSAFDGANCPSIIFEHLGPHDMWYVLGLLNSKLISYQLRTVCPPKLGGYVRYSASYLTKVPLRVIDFAESTEKLQHDNVVKCVDRMLVLTSRGSTSKTSHEQEAIYRQIESLDHQIDELVYELYGLTEEEIRIVEEATG